MQNWRQTLRETYWDARAGRFPDLKRFRACLTGSVVNVRGVRIRIHRSLPYEVAKALIYQSYESPERSLLDGLLRNDDVVMELGAGIGYISTFCAQIIGSERVFTYEANPKMEPLIQDTYRLNGVSPTVHLCMVGERAGTAAFHASDDFTVSSKLPLSRDAELITVTVVAFQAELERIEPTILIVDIEGGEYEIFQRPLPNACRLILLELHPQMLGDRRAAQVLAWIKAMGFTVNATAHNSYLFRRADHASPGSGDKLTAACPTTRAPS
jgi:FkbM family methyltransferase